MPGDIDKLAHCSPMGEANIERLAVRDPTLKEAYIRPAQVESNNKLAEGVSGELENVVPLRTLFIPWMNSSVDSPRLSKASSIRKSPRRRSGEACGKGPLAASGRVAGCPTFNLGFTQVDCPGVPQSFVAIAQQSGKTRSMRCSTPCVITFADHAIAIRGHWENHSLREVSPGPAAALDTLLPKFAWPQWWKDVL